ncbi:MAG: PilX N-terminal domain-containing pilus assembly protein [Amphritea sp.]|nr:PilX N-terminal domain-containing pilus assembly protein [Amphritea sp.]
MKNVSHGLVRQQGATLIVALIVLLALTLIGSGALQGNILQSRMVANQQNQELAFQASEAGLQAAEGWLGGLVVEPDIVSYRNWTAQSTALVFDSRGGDLSLIKQLAAPASTKNWQQRARTMQSYNPAATTIPGAPDITVELIAIERDEISSDPDGDSTSLDRFRQVSRSLGQSGQSEVILQTEYQIRFR